MSANIKASVDGTQAIIGVGGVDQMTVSNAGVVTANSFVGNVTSGGTFSGNASSATALATGSTTARTLANRFDDFVNVKDFGAVGNWNATTGTGTDDSVAIQDAIDSLGQNGGTVVIPNGMKCLVDSNITISRHVSLVGPLKMVGSPQDNNYTPYQNLGGAIILNSSATINTEGNSTISGLLIYRKGMTFPAPNASAFAGTAITCGGDDVSVLNCMILGFNLAFYSSNIKQRQKLEYLMLDNTNGIEINQCLDIAYISNCHAWPFATIAASGTAAKLVRTGTAYKFQNTADWCKITNCFSYGYNRGFSIIDANSCTLIGCGADNVPNTALLNPNSCGFFISKEIGGTASSIETRLIGCQAAAQDTAGIYIDNGAVWTTIDDFNCWCSQSYRTQHGILIAGGNAVITNSVFRDTVNGISTSSATSELVIDNNVTAGVINKSVQATVTNDASLIGRNNKFNLTSFINPVVGFQRQLVTPSANTCNLSQFGDIFLVSGTNDFNILQHGWYSRRVVLVFNGILTVTATTNPTPPVNEMVLATPTFISAGGSTLTLIHDGTVWREISRTP
jgi:hypothetical protein